MSARHPPTCRCWCGRAGIEYAKLGALDASRCDYDCSGDPSLKCGGYNTFNLYQYEVLGQRAGHLGCYADVKRDRLFADYHVDANGLTAAVSVFLGSCVTGESCCLVVILTFSL